MCFHQNIIKRVTVRRYIKITAHVPTAHADAPNHYITVHLQLGRKNPKKKSEFTKDFNADNLHIKQIHIKPDPEITARRKELVEHPFGTIKRAMDAGYCLTKGLKNVTGEFSLVFLAYNMKRAINILGAKRLINAMA